LIGYCKHLPAPSTAPSITLGSETAPPRRVQQGDYTISDKEENSCEEDEFINIDNIEEENILLVVGGSFSTTNRGLKPKRVKAKES